MGHAIQTSVDFADSRMRILEAFELRGDISPSGSLPVHEPALRRLGQLICLGTCVFSGWMIWTLASFIAS